MKELKPTPSFLLFGLAFLFVFAVGTPIKLTTTEVENIHDRGFPYSLPYLSQPEATSISELEQISGSEAEEDKLPRGAEAAANSASAVIPLNYVRDTEEEQVHTFAWNEIHPLVPAASEVLSPILSIVVQPMPTPAPQVKDKKASFPANTEPMRWNHQAFSSDLTKGEPIEIETIYKEVVWLTGAYIRTDSLWEETMTTTTTTHSRYHRPTTDLWPVVTWSASSNVEYSDGVSYTTFNIVPRATAELREDSPQPTPVYKHFHGPPVETLSRLSASATKAARDCFAGECDPNKTNAGPQSMDIWGLPLQTFSALAVAPGPVMMTSIPIAPGPVLPTPRVAEEEGWRYSLNLALASIAARNEANRNSAPHSVHSHTTTTHHHHGSIPTPLPYTREHPTLTTRIRPSPLATIRDEAVRCTTTAVQLMSPQQRGATKTVWTSTTTITAEVDCKGCSLTVWIPDSTKRFHFTKTKTLPGVFEFVTQGCRPSHTPLDPRDFDGSL